MPRQVRIDATVPLEIREGRLHRPERLSVIDSGTVQQEYRSALSALDVVHLRLFPAILHVTETGYTFAVD